MVIIANGQKWLFSDNVALMLIIELNAISALIISLHLMEVLHNKMAKLL